MEFLQNDLRSSRLDYKDFGGNSNSCPGKLPLAKDSYSIGNNTSFHDSPQHYFLQLDNISFPQIKFIKQIKLMSHHRHINK